MVRENKLMEVRTSLTTTSNTGGGDTRTGVGGVEIQKLIDRLIVEDINRQTDFRQLVSRKPLNQAAYIWNIRKSLGSTTKADFYSEGGTGTPYPSEKKQLVAAAKALRSDYEVTGLMVAASSSYYDAAADEARDAVSELILREEKSFICGTDASAYGDTGSYVGLLQLMGSYVTFSSTTTTYGTARASGETWLDVSLVAAAASGSTDALTLADLDSAITTSNKVGGKGDRRIFLVSEERGDEISQLLQPQGRFVIGASMGVLDGGTEVLKYKGLPIVRSRYMDKNGITWTSPTLTVSHADNAMYLLDMDEIEFRVLAGVDAKHVPISGSDSGLRYDVSGGYLKTYGVFVMKNFSKQVLIYNLAAP